MNYDVLHNFISPVTGRVLSDPEYVLVGDYQGIAMPSPILIDIRLELIDLRKEVDDLESLNNRVGFIISQPDAGLPKAQALSNLDDGFMYNTGGIISTTNDLPLPSLEYKHLWIGDSNNQPQAVTTIDIDNLPSLGITDVPTPTGGFVGKVWEGTSSGRPEESSIVGEMFADITALNAKFLAGKFVMNSGLTASFPKAQFLNALTAGALVKTSSAGDGKLESVVINQDQVLMGGANNVPESRVRIGVENLPLLADKKLWSGNADSIPQSITTIDISNLPNLANNNLWLGGEDNRPIAKVNIDISNLPNLEQHKLWIGDAGNRPVAQSTLNIDNLPNLTNNMVWQGNAQGRPAEVELNFAPSDATYIIKQPNVTLTNAQVLSELGVGMAKIIAGGAFAIAIPDEDYATKATLEQIKAETEEFKNQAANSAEQAATSAEEASASATEAASSATEAAASATEATTAAGEATAAAAEASGAAAAASGSAGAAGLSAAGAAASALAAGASSSSASSSASDASSSASDAHDSAISSAGSASQSLQYLNQLLNTGINLVGDVLGSGPLKDPITLTFKANPIFTGTGSMTIPVGTTAQRPNNPVLGMTRINTDL